MKKETKILKYYEMFLQSYSGNESLSQTRNFNHSKCLKFFVCERFYKHFFKTSKDSEIFMTYSIEIRFTLRYFSKKKL